MFGQSAGAMSTSYHYLNDYFSSLARAAVCDNLSHVDEMPALMVTPLTDR